MTVSDSIVCFATEIISGTNSLDVKSGDEYAESSRRVCLICGSTEKELSLYVLKRPEQLNGGIQKELSSIQSSFLISNDQEGEQYLNKSF